MAHLTHNLKKYLNFFLHLSLVTIYTGWYLAENRKHCIILQFISF